MGIDDFSGQGAPLGLNEGDDFHEITLLSARLFDIHNYPYLVIIHQSLKIPFPILLLGVGVWYGDFEPAAEQLEKDYLIKLPGAVLIGISQGGMAWGGDSQVVQFALTTPQASDNLPERMGAPQLAEEHGQELTPAG